ncbi:SigE family RNA polymerase sigma factor [Catellatospora sp. KI3]|uniref:SigE family RNA polymerase sigma factor n=1 Tax=Catellatospora sp. KI3 TaxID=3041620 RepID=UPI0024826ACF|nr:SigE family RNA polymerase sigma factor [Catellatospora sp. KI3]MDI1464115.1 SigE family RNA polymerase sigma factor [Catellatospora sp. KI3]
MVEDFEGFVRARSTALARTAYLLTGDRHQAEDLLQDTLARVAERWTAVSRGGDPEPYVRRMLYTRAIDGWRGRQRRAALDTTEARQRPELRGRPDDADTVTRRLVLRDALARLTQRQRAVLVLRFYEDLTEVQTAEALHCSPNTVKSQTRHALERLRQLAPELADLFGPGTPVEAR